MIGFGYVSTFSKQLLTELSSNTKVDMNEHNKGLMGLGIGIGFDSLAW